MCAWTGKVFYAIAAPEPLNLFWTDALGGLCPQGQGHILNHSFLRDKKVRFPVEAWISKNDLRMSAFVY